MRADRLDDGSQGTALGTETLLDHAHPGPFNLAVYGLRRFGFPTSAFPCNYLPKPSQLFLPLSVAVSPLSWLIGVLGTHAAAVER